MRSELRSEMPVWNLIRLNAVSGDDGGIVAAIWFWLPVRLPANYPFRGDLAMRENPIFGGDGVRRWRELLRFRR